MSFLCRVRLNPDVARVLEDFPTDIRERVGRGEVLHTVEEQDFLRKLCNRLPRASVLMHAFFDESVDWVGRGKSRPHVRRQASSGDSDTDAGSPTQFEHDWAKWQLYRYGILLGQKPRVEHRLGDGRRCDVSWQVARIAWEIDLTPQAQLDQDTRVRRTAAAGYFMISLVDFKDKNRTNSEHPRLRFGGLKNAEHYEKRHVPWAAASVGGVCDLSNDEPLEWTWRPKFRFSDFCRALLKNELAWQPLGDRPIRWTNARRAPRAVHPRAWRHSKESAPPPRFAWVSPDHHAQHLRASAPANVLRTPLSADRSDRERLMALLPPASLTFLRSLEAGSTTPSDQVPQTASGAVNVERVHHAVATPGRVVAQPAKPPNNAERVQRAVAVPAQVVAQPAKSPNNDQRTAARAQVVQLAKPPSGVEPAERASEVPAQVVTPTTLQPTTATVLAQPISAPSQQHGGGATTRIVRRTSTLPGFRKKGVWKRLRIFWQRLAHALGFQ